MLTEVSTETASADVRGEARPTIPLRHRPMLALAGAAGYLGGLHLINPFRPHPVGCPFLAVTGSWCPGCGSSRAAYRLSHGDIIGSLTYHPLVIPIVALFTWWWASWFVTARTGDAPRWARSPTQLPPRLVLTILAAFIVLWGLRNVPGFEFLAPPT